MASSSSVRPRRSYIGRCTYICTRQRDPGDSVLAGSSECSREDTVAKGSGRGRSGRHRHPRRLDRSHRRSLENRRRPPSLPSSPRSSSPQRASLTAPRQPHVEPLVSVLTVSKRPVARLGNTFSAVKPGRFICSSPLLTCGTLDADSIASTGRRRSLCSRSS